MRIIGAIAGLKGRNYYFEHCNRNKRGIVLDMKQPARLEAFLRLIDTADVFVNNLSIEAPARMGIDLPVMLPGIGGEMEGLVCAWAVCAARYAREKTGQGQLVDTSLMGSVIANLGFLMAAPAILEQEFSRETRTTAGNLIYNHYRCTDGTSAPRQPSTSARRRNTGHTPRRCWPGWAIRRSRSRSSRPRVCWGGPPRPGKPAQPWVACGRPKPCALAAGLALSLGRGLHNQPLNLAGQVPLSVLLHAYRRCL
ncbi:hypothetical protein DFAR_2970006 [Desulfarculales bacterium]